MGAAFRGKIDQGITLSDPDCGPELGDRGRVRSVRIVAPRCRQPQASIMRAQIALTSGL